MAGELLERRIGQVLEDLSRHQVATASGSAAALSAAFAAALTTMVGRASRERWPGAGGAIAEAEALRARLGRLAEQNAEAFATARRLMLRARADREHHGAPVAPGAGAVPGPDERARALAEALRAAAEMPALIAEAAAEVAVVTAAAAREAGPDHRADAVVALTLAEAAARAAAHLVRINLGLTPEDPIAVRAAAAATDAASALSGLTEHDGPAA